MDRARTAPIFRRRRTADAALCRIFAGRWRHPAATGRWTAPLSYIGLTHGTSNRLHGNTAGLSTNMARGLGEGWSDFYAAALLSEPTDDPCGVHAVGGYISFNIAAGYTNHYYGLRRFPLARIGCVGANGVPYDPLTFRNLNAGSCAAFDAAFPRAAR